MSKLIAVQGCTIKYDLPEDPGGQVVLVATVTPASSKVKAGGATAYKDKISIVVASGTVTVTQPPEGCAPQGVVPPGTIDISGTSQKATTEGQSFVLVDDEGDATFECVFPLSSGTDTKPGDVKIRAKVTAAGQNVTKAT